MNVNRRLFFSATALALVLTSGGAYAHSEWWAWSVATPVVEVNSPASEVVRSIPATD